MNSCKHGNPLAGDCKACARQLYLAGGVLAICGLIGGARGFAQHQADYDAQRARDAALAECSQKSGDN